MANGKPNGKKKNGNGGKKRSYAPEIKAQVMAQLVAGQLTISEAAVKYKIPESTIKTWSSQRGTVEAVGQEKKEIGELLVGYLRENLETLKAQAKFFRTEDWLKQQDASGAAILHGVLTDKTVRLLEALGGASLEAPAEGPGEG